MSRGFGQGELLAPEPTRRLIVPAGHTSWWGCDPSTVRVSLATVTIDGERLVETAVFPQLDGGERLARMYQIAHDLAANAAVVAGAPGVIVVEQPSGKTPNPNLVYAVGVIQAALYGGAQSVLRARIPLLETVASSRWKAVACGRGDIRKPKPTAREDYGVLQWARTAGYEGSSWDEADAWGVADYARRTFLLEVR